MSGPLRSKQGCWTCRLRRKKCDESRPHCSTCESLLIPCYGFGPKPEWMDGAANERAVANSLKETVRHTYRRKLTSHSAVKRAQGVNIAPAPSTHASTMTSGNHLNHDQSESLDSWLSNGSSGEGQTETLQALPRGPSLPASETFVGHGNTSSISALETEYLVCFLDHVFPLQYPMYHPEVSGKGRGWLLALLLRSKPLYEAALALGAYYQRMKTSPHMSQSAQAAALVQQETHLERCLWMLNLLANGSCSAMEMGVVIAITQSVYFELYSGNSNAWKAHIRAAVAIYQKSYSANFTPFKLAAETRAALEDGLPDAYGDRITEEIAILRFLITTVFWLDVSSSVTAGTSPHLQHHPSANDLMLRCEEIIGCRTSIMLQFGRIASLHERGLRARLPESSIGETLDQAVRDIDDEIQYGIAQLGSEDPLAPSVLVSRMFADAALIYLHLVTRGFQHLGMLDETITGATARLQNQIPTRLLPAVMMPLFFLSCVARSEDQTSFECVLSREPMLDPLLKHRTRILPILREIWSRRRTVADLEWANVLELTNDVLLV